MKNLAIYGAGGFGRETAWMIHEINQLHDQWNLVGFFDDGYPLGSLIDGLPVLGGIESLNNTNDLNLVVAIADPQTRRGLVGKIANRKIHFPNVIHPTAQIGSPSNMLGRGLIITACVCLTTSVHIDDFVIINLATTVGHDVRLGPYSSLMPQCSISGNVNLGSECFVGSGVRILQGITLGGNCVVGAGAVVTKSFPGNSRLAGIPAKLMSS